MSDFYQLTNSTSDFKSRSSDVFDKLINLEKQHDVQIKTQTPVVVPDEESSSQQNPNIPTHAITFKKRSADDTFFRPTDKWKKYDLEDVNEHHMSSRGNQHALNDFLRTRTKPQAPEKEEEEQTPAPPVFKRPLKKEILTNEDDDDEGQQFVSIRIPVPPKPKETDRNDDETTAYKLISTRKKTRGVFSTNEKKPVKSSMEISEDKDDAEEKEDDDDEDVDDEPFEP